LEQVNHEIETNKQQETVIPYINPFSNLGEKDNSSMDWSSETPASSLSMPMPHISPAGEHMPSPQVSSSQSSSNSNNISKQLDTVSKVLDYGNSQLIHPEIWSGLHLAMSIFGTEESRSEDVHNIALSISRIEMFMWCNHIEGKKASEGFNIIAEQIRLLI